MFTIADLKRLEAEGFIRGFTAPESGSKGTQKAPTAKKGSKYGAKPTEYEGVRFDSIKELKRYKELKMLLKAGHIAYLERQVPYELNPGGTHSLKYIADFEYYDIGTGQKITEDCKGYRTRDYKKKKRLMFKVHGIKILET